MKNRITPMEEISIKAIVSAIEEAITDDLTCCLRASDIPKDKSNAKKNLIWDLINRNAERNMKKTPLSAKYAKRGPWNMVPIYDTSNRWIYTIMRAERFKTLQKNQPGRKKAHYMDAFAKSFNLDLLGPKQISMFDDQQFTEQEVKSAVEGIMKAFESEGSEIKRYAVILFEEFNGVLVSVKCCTIDPTLEIIDFEDWSQYIRHEESVVVEKQTDHEVNLGITLKKPSEIRIETKKEKLVSLKEDETDDLVIGV